jgi:hypothetical protein
MRKAILRSGDKVIELEMPDGWDNVLPTWAREFLGMQTVVNTIRQSNPNVESKPNILTSHIELGGDWIFLAEVGSDRRGREDKSKCRIYSSENSGEIVGIVYSETGNNKPISLGSPDDDTSKVSQVIKAIRAMPFHETFSRRKLSENLSSTFDKGDLMRVALGYAEHIGKIKKLHRDRLTGAMLYQRITDIGDSGQQVGTQVTEATIPLSNTKQ